MAKANQASRFPALLVVPILCCLTSAEASSKIIRVSQTAPGPSRDGASWATAYTRIQAGLDVAGADDEVWVAKGVYSEDVTVAAAGLGLYGGFAGTETAWSQRDIKANLSEITVGWLMTTGAAGIKPVTVSGFTFQNCAGGITVDGPSAVISDNVISGTNGSTSGIALAIHGTVTASNNLITGNWTSTTGTIYVFQDGQATLTNNVISMNQAIQGAGIYVEGSATISNNLICNNASFSRGGGVYVSSGGTATLVNNTLAGNMITGGDGAGLFTDGSATVTNTIIAANDSGLGAASGASLTVSNCDVFGNTAWDFKGIANPTGSAGNISSDPAFRGGDDYHLMGGSLCIDSGSDSAVATGAVDLDGKPRIFGPHVDIGAYEYVAPPKFVATDVVRALRVSAGLETQSPADFAFLNAETGGNSASAIDVADAVRIARKVANLDVNP